MKKLLLLSAVILAYVGFAAAQSRSGSSASHSSGPAYHAPAPSYHAPAPAYHAPQTHTAPSYHPAPRQTQSHNNNPKPSNTQRNADRDQRNAQRNADREKRNADKNAAKAHSNARKQENKTRHARNKQLHRDNKAARAAFHNGRFNARFYGAHFGREHHFGFCGVGRFWIGDPYDSPFWFGGVEFAFAPGVIWPGAWGRCDAFYIDYIDGAGYALVDPAYAGVTLPLAVDIGAQPMDEPDMQ